MKRNFVVGVFGGLIGSAMLLLLLSMAGVVGARAIQSPPEVARPQEVSAATPLTSTFTYQGQLKNGGNAVNGSCQMAFRLYDDPSSSTNLIGGPFTTTVPITNGLFTVGLNFGSSVFNGDGRWLDIQVNCNNTGFVALTPRQGLTPAPYALALPGLYTTQNITSPNIIGGYSGNTVAPDLFAAAIGGGGDSNSPNRVQANYATVGGGRGNIASSIDATIGGGANNTASGPSATIGGGRHNQVSSWTWESTIGGGRDNTASGPDATISGGENNTAGGNYATVPGGLANSATMSYTFAAGRRAKANHDGVFVWADSTNDDFASTDNDQFLVRAIGGVGINTRSPATNTLTVGGNGLRVGVDGTTLKRIQAGQASLGTGLSGVNVYTITFPTAFTNIPTIFITPYNDPNFDAGNDPDTFAVTIRRRTTTQFVVNVFRIDNLGGGWAQSLRLNWYAGE